MAEIERRVSGFISLMTDDENGEIAWLGVSDSLAELRTQAITELKRVNSPTVSIMMVPVVETLRLSAPAEGDGPDEIHNVSPIIRS